LLRITAPLLDEVSGERAAATVAALAGDLFAGRRVGSAGGAAARGWLVDQLTSLGADGGTQAFEVPSVPEVYRAPQVRWHNGIETQALTFGRDVGLPVASAELARVRQAPLAVVGRGDTAGCWAVVPHDMGLVEAYDHAGAAVGLLISRAVDGFGWQYTMLAGLPAGRLPVLGVESALHQRLLAAAGDARLRAWWEADAPVRRVTVTGANVHARLADAAEGVDVLLTAH
jgi:hypothetical protein